MRRKKRLIPLSRLLQADCMGEFATYADCLYVDIQVASKMKRKHEEHEHKNTKHNYVLDC